MIHTAGIMNPMTAPIAKMLSAAPARAHAAFAPAKDVAADIRRVVKTNMPVFISFLH